MKVYASISATVLLFHLAVGARIIGPDGADPPISCCPSYSSRIIPLKLLANYYRTSEKCSTPATVFITKKGREICANPTERWVQDHVCHLEQI